MSRKCASMLAQNAKSTNGCLDIQRGSYRTEWLGGAELIEPRSPVSLSGKGYSKEKR